MTGVEALAAVEQAYRAVEPADKVTWVRSLDIPAAAAALASAPTSPKWGGPARETS